ncbi:sulfonate ABC transporter substrate-binding protein [Streptosporangium violaceochromogenes]|nr:sulfonate ABC transporter substrate-binding protein [Streptosporangium violaceochromogenes]
MISTACGGGQTPSSGKGLEKPDLVIGTMPIPDAAAFHIAKTRGFFTREGFRSIRLETIRGTGPAIPQLENGQLDIALLNYVSAFTAQSKGAVDLRIIADAYQADADTFLLMTPADSSAESLADLKGKTVAVATLHSIGTLMLEIALRIDGLTVKDVHLVEMPLPNMPGALTAGTVQAAWMAEPFITAAKARDGAKTLADMASGPTADFPIAGWGITSEFAQKNPRTVAAFQRAITAGQEIAAADRKAVVDIVPSYTQIPANIAKVITLGQFPLTLSATRLQRVADQMIEFDYLDQPLKVAPLLLPPAVATPAAPTPTNGAS